MRCCPGRAAGAVRGAEFTGLYLRQIGATPLLTAVQEVELARRIEAGVYARHLLEELARYARIERKLALRLGRDPTPAELATAAGQSPERIARLRRLEERCVSLDTPIGEPAVSSTAVMTGTTGWSALFADGGHDGPAQHADGGDQPARLTLLPQRRGDRRERAH